MKLDPVVQSGLERLNALLPLAARQQELDSATRLLHRAVLQHFITHGGVPPQTALASQADGPNINAILDVLAERDLIVRGSQGEIVGAYPMTTEHTPHRVHVNGHWIHAMCAVDAMAIAPMYDAQTRVESVCPMTGTAIVVQQFGDAIEAAQPAGNLRVGIRWQDPGHCAAHTLCREMIFLADPTIAQRWAQSDPPRCSLFTLDQAAALARAFFRPLLQD